MIDRSRIEELYGMAWAALAKKEGHRKALPPHILSPEEKYIIQNKNSRALMLLEKMPENQWIGSTGAAVLMGWDREKAKKAVESLAKLDSIESKVERISKYDVVKIKKPLAD